MHLKEQCSVVIIETDLATGDIFAHKTYDYPSLGTGDVCCIVEALQMCRLHGTY